MAMTTEQRERLLGMLLLGASSVTACESLAIPYCDLIAELDANEPFRYGYQCAQSQRDSLNRALGKG
jgi:hypothetical protein